MLSMAWKKRWVTLLSATVYVLLSLNVIFIVAPTDGGYSIKVRPVVHRVLIPAVIHSFQAIIPSSAEKSLTPMLISFRDSHYGKCLLHINSNPSATLSNDRIFQTSTVLFVVLLSLLAFVWTLHMLALELFPDSRLYALVAPLIALLLLPVFITRYFYIYDFAELFFSCACFYLLLKERWKTYFLCLVAATLNKETSIFVIFFYFAWFWKILPRPLYLQRGVMQLWIYSVIQLAIHIAYINVRPWVEGGKLMRRVAAVSDYDYYSFACLIFTVMLVTYRWQEKPAFLRAGLVMSIANIAVFMIWCTPGEYRDLYWGMPVLILLATHTLVRLSGAQHMPLFLQDKKED